MKLVALGKQDSTMAHGQRKYNTATKEKGIERHGGDSKQHKDIGHTNPDPNPFPDPTPSKHHP